MAKILFRRIGGRIIPIIPKKNASLLITKPAAPVKTGSFKADIEKTRSMRNKINRKSKAFKDQQSWSTFRVREALTKLPHYMTGYPKPKMDKKTRQALTKSSQLKALDKKVQKEFGYTQISEDAGFIDRRGRMIDLSARNQGNTFGGRVRDHREINSIFQDPRAKSDTENLFRFMKNTKAIRMSDHGSVFNVDFVERPTVGQLSKLKDITTGKTIYADYTNEMGDTINSGEFQDIVQAIRMLFKGQK